MGDKVVRLVTDTAPACSDNAGLARWLRVFADNIEAGVYGSLETVAFVVERDNGEIGRASQSLQTHTPLDTFRLVGILSMAAHNAQVAAPNFLAGD